MSSTTIPKRKAEWHGPPHFGREPAAAEATESTPAADASSSAEPEVLTSLVVLNSLTKQKEVFRPLGRGLQSNQIKMYICGPTVYDSSHMGHARNYVGFDVISRILTDYFQYDVTLVMNITDIDDKIILRSRERGMEFSELATIYEAEYMEDMRLLGVRPPTILTRVSEYVPEVISFIEGIMKNGFAYESNNSVYFDTDRFTKDPNHFYAKLKPMAINDAELLEEGEGKLSAGNTDKRNQSDFALWKASKEGEPSWESPWGQGRPGWHIECSAMSSVLGDHLDMHGGGVDLKFPHHDNEIAQSEAHYNSKQWVNYWLHSGHLHIENCKMSKSLKNFITIRDALSKYTARQLRMLFLVHSWNSTMDYSEASMSTAADIEKTFANFFATVSDLVRKAGNASGPQKFRPQEFELNEFFLSAKAGCHQDILDSFNTPGVIKRLQELVKVTNKYLESEKEPRALLLSQIAQYITRLFKVFGLVENDTIGYLGGGAASVEPIIASVCEFRSDVRAAARANDASKVLDACDQFRDEVMPLHGVRFEDQVDNTKWSMDDPAVIKKEVALKRERAQAAQAAKEARAAKALLEKQEREATALIAPTEYLATLPKFAGCTFDENTGLPVSRDGKPVSKALVKAGLKHLKSHAVLRAKLGITVSSGDGTKAAPAAAST